MYEESLESLIQRCIADGVLTPSEIDVLRRRAEKCGEDPDEVVIYAEGLLAEKQEKTKRDDQLAAKAAEHAAAKVGKVRTCPACGNSIPATVLVCPHCKHELRDTKSSEAVTEFFNKYTQAKANQKVSLVEAFPVPNDKESLTEFASMAGPQAVSVMKLSRIHKLILTMLLAGIVGAIVIICAKISGASDLGELSAGVCGGIGLLAFVVWSIMGTGSDDEDKEESHQLALSNAWNSKLNQVITKINIMGASDPSWVEGIRMHLAVFEKKRKFPMLATSVLGGVLAVLLLVALLIKPAEPKCYEQIDAEYARVMQELNALETPNEDNYLEVQDKLLGITWMHVPNEGSDAVGYQLGKRESYENEKQAIANKIIRIYKQKGVEDIPDELLHVKYH